MDIKIHLSYFSCLLSISDLCLKKVNDPQKGENEALNNSFEDLNFKPMKLLCIVLRELTQLPLGALQMYGQARRLEMHKCIAKFIKGI